MQSSRVQSSPVAPEETRLRSAPLFSLARAWLWHSCGAEKVRLPRFLLCPAPSSRELPPLFPASSLAPTPTQSRDSDCAYSSPIPGNASSIKNKVIWTCIYVYTQCYSSYQRAKLARPVAVRSIDCTGSCVALGTKTCTVNLREHRAAAVADTR